MAGITPGSVKEHLRSVNISNRKLLRYNAQTKMAIPTLNVLGNLYKMSKL